MVVRHYDEFVAPSSLQPFQRVGRRERLALRLAHLGLRRQLHFPHLPVGNSLVDKSDSVLLDILALLNEISDILLL